MNQLNTCDLLIDSLSCVLPDSVVAENYAIAIQGNRIAAIGPSLSIRQQWRPAHMVDGSGKVAIPGLVDSHTHTVQQLLRGGVVDERPMIWSRILLPYEDQLSDEDIYWAAMLCSAEMISAVITCFSDNGSRQMESVIDATIASGLRGSITRMTRDAGGDAVLPTMKETTAVAIEKSENLYKKYDGAANGRIKIVFSITNPMAASPELLEGIAEKARQYGTIVHTHMSEHVREVETCLMLHGLRPAEYFEAHGLLGPNLLAAHAIQLSSKDIKLIAERHAKIVHCPTANLTNHGFAKLPELLANGVDVALATDGAATGLVDLFAVGRLQKYSTQAHHGLPIYDYATLPYPTVFQMYTLKGATALGLQDEIGSLEVGKKADITLIDWMQPHLNPTREILQTLVMAASARDVCDVIVDGRFLFKDRQFTTLDIQEITAKATQALNRMIGRP
ncbi:MAG: amidohydrolase [Chloroflexi bacterium]|nr:amidohydrolase [Chloroflexota bacterium]